MRRADVVPRLAGVVGAVHAAVELHVERVGLQRGPMHVVHAEGVRAIADILGQVARDEALVPSVPGGSGVLGDPHARRGDRDREPRRVVRPRADRVQAHAARARLPVGSRRLVPEAAVDGPGTPAVLASEERRRRDARPEHVRLDARLDDPDPLDRGVAIGRESRALRLLPLARGIHRVVYARPELPVGDRSEVAPAPRITHRELDRVPRELPGDLGHRAAPRSSQHEQPLAGADEELGLILVAPHRLRLRPLLRLDRAARDGGQHVHLVARADGGLERRFLAVYEEHDVGTHRAALVDHPALELRVALLQPAEDLAERPALDIQLGVAACELPEG